jgi:hypothetical protein
MSKFYHLISIVAVLFCHQLTWAQPPELLSFAPTSAWPGEVVEISGNNLTNVTGVDIGASSGLILHQNDTLIRFVVGPGASTGFITANHAAGSVNTPTEIVISNTNIYAMPSHLIEKVDEPDGFAVDVAISADGSTAVSSDYGTIRIYHKIGNAFEFDTAITRAGYHGAAIALSAAGTTVAVGAPTANGGRGSLYIYERINGVWQEQLSTLPASVTGVSIAGSNFGSSVAISADGNTVVAGAPAEAANAGAVCTFIKIGNVWSQLGGEVTGANVIGGNPSLQGNTTVLLNNNGSRLAVFGNDSGGRGAVWVFNRIGAGWTQIQKIPAQDPATIYGIGTSGGAFSFDGRFLFVGAISSYVPPPNANAEGAVLVYEWTGNTYVYRQRINSSQPMTYAYFGRSVSANADGSFLAIGEWEDPSPTGGRVRTFYNDDLANGQWVELPLPLRYDPPGNYDPSTFDPDDGQGRSVALSLDSRWLIMGSHQAQFGFYAYNASPPPSISSFTPVTGTQGTQITITGQHLETAWHVAINGVQASGVNRLPNGQVRATMGAATNGQGDVTVTTKGGQFSLPGFTYVEPPQITSFNPVSAGPGEQVVITGQNLLATQSVLLNGVPVNTFTVVDNNTVSIVVGSGATGAITLTTSYGQSVSADPFTFMVPQPVITSFYPDQAGPYETVTIVGENFEWVEHVTFGTTPALNFSINADGHIEAVVAYGTSGEVHVSSDGGTGALSGFQYNAPQPETFALDRNAGPAGTLISVFGNDVIGTNYIMVNGNPAVIAGRSNEKLSAIVMPGSSSGAVTLSVDGVDANSPGDFNVTSRMVPDTQQGSFVMGNFTPTNVYIGERIAVSADRNVVAIGEPLQAFNGAYDGNIHMFIRTQANLYEEIQSIVVPLVDANWGGYMMALSGDGTRLVMQSNYLNDTIQVYDRASETEWVLNYKFAAPYRVASIALSPDGETLVIGRQTSHYAQQIIVSVLNLSSTHATLLHQFTPPNQIPASSLTASVALSLDGSTIAVGSYRDNQYRGALWIYRFDAATQNWISSPKLIPNDAVHQLPSETDGARVGCKVSVSANGMRVVVSGELDGNAAPKGAVWSYAFDGTNWIQQGPKIKPVNMANGNSYFGYSLELSADGNYFSVGTFGVGEFWNYQWDGTSWITQGPKVIPDGPSNHKTTDLAMTPDGNYVFCLSHNNGFAIFRNSTLTEPSHSALSMDIDTLDISESPVVLYATSSSPGVITYTVQEGSTAAATMAGNTLELNAPGTLIIRIVQQPTSDFLGAMTYDTIIVTGQPPLVSQSIDFPTIPAQLVNSVAYILNASATSGLPVVYTSSDPQVATVNGNVLTMVGWGQAIITASQNGNEIFASALSVEQIVVVNRLDQEVVFNPLDKKIFFYDGDFPLDATASSGEPISFISDNPLVATINDNIVSITGAGVAIITAVQPGNDMYNPAQVQQNLLVSAPYEQNVRFEPLGELNLDQSPIQLEAKSSSGLPVQFSTNDPAVATIVGDILILHSEGETTVTASQPGNNFFQPAPGVEHPLVVSRGPIVISGRQRTGPNENEPLAPEALPDSERSTEVYPNPTSAKLIVRISERSDFTLLDQTNREIHNIPTTQISQNLVEMNLESIASGIYILMIKQVDEIKVVKVFKR